MPVELEVLAAQTAAVSNNNPSDGNPSYEAVVGYSTDQVLDYITRTGFFSNFSNRTIQRFSEIEIIGRRFVLNCGDPSFLENTLFFCVDPKLGKLA